MKVLIVSNSITGGGAERSMRIVNSELNKKGVESLLLCLNNSDSDVAKAGEVILNRAWKEGLPGTIKNFLEFMKILISQKPTTVIANCELPELFVALAPVRMKNLICVEHTSLPWAGRRSLGKAVRLLLILRRPSWVTVNRNQDGIWPFHGESKYIPNPVEIPILDPSCEGKMKFLYVGRLRAEKGIERILKGISEAGTSIDVFGSGNLEEELIKTFNSCARFHGFVTNPWQQVNNYQTLIIASEYEGDGIVIVEAILARIPILLLDNNDLRRFQLPESNYFKNHSDLVSKIKQALENCDHFRVPEVFANQYKVERNLESVTKAWLAILK